MSEDFASLVADDPACPAIVDEFAILSRAQFNERVNRLIHGLRAAGLQPGDAVGVLASNRHEFFEVVGAVGASSWVLVPLNWHFTPDELAYVLNDSGAKALVADTAFADQAVAALAQAPGVTVRLMFGGPPAGEAGHSPPAGEAGHSPPAGEAGHGPPAAEAGHGVAAEGFSDYEEILAGASGEEPADQATGSYMLYTSGTTGRPKGVRSTAFAVGQSVAARSAMLEGLAGLFQIPRGGSVLVNSPLYHGGPFLFSMLPAGLGATVVLRQRFDPAETLRLIDEHRITTAYFVPTHFVRLLRVPEEERAAFDGSSLQAVYHTAAPCPPEVKRQMLEWWGPVVHELYAATETGALGTFITGDEWLKKPGSVGRAMPVVEVLVLGERGERLGPNETGQIYIRNLMGGDFEYHGAPEKTAEAHLEPGVMTVGDVGYLDDDGFLFLCDRKIDMIISGGVNIYPAEIEAVLVTHPAVADAAVIGVPNEEFGEEVKAVVELAPGHQASEGLASELTTFARERLAGYKAPRSIEFQDHLPRTPTGKLLKRELRDPYWIGQDRAI